MRLAAPNPASPGCLSCSTVARPRLRVSIPPIALMPRPPRSVPPGRPPAYMDPRPRGARRAQGTAPRGAQGSAPLRSAALVSSTVAPPRRVRPAPPPPAAPLAAAPPRRRFRLLRWAVIATIWGTLALGLVLLWFARDLPRPESALDATRRPSLTLEDRSGHVFASFGDCWNNKGHGEVSIVSALTHSCDVFFYTSPSNSRASTTSQNGRTLSDWGKRRASTSRAKFLASFPLKNGKRNVSAPNGTPARRSTSASVRDTCWRRRFSSRMPTRRSETAALSIDRFLIKDVESFEGDVLERFSPVVLNKINFKPETIESRQTGTLGSRQRPWRHRLRAIVYRAWTWSERPEPRK